MRYGGQVDPWRTTPHRRPSPWWRVAADDTTLGYIDFIHVSDHCVFRNETAVAEEVKATYVGDRVETSVLLVVYWPSDKACVRMYVRAIQCVVIRAVCSTVLTVHIHTHTTHTYTHTTHTRTHTHTHTHTHTFPTTYLSPSYVISGDADGKVNFWDWKSSKLFQ